MNGAERGFDYRGSLVYNRNGTSSSLESAAFGAGRIIKTSTGYEVRYFLTDHLGSVRASVNQAGQVTDRSDYQLLGERWSGSGVEATTNRYQFNGKESQTLLSDANGISNFLDYGARHYNSNIGRWFTPDPLSGQYLNLSPYNYCAANPIKFIDPSGEDYFLAVDYKTQTITVKANYYTNQHGARALSNGLAFWNKQKLTYANKNGVKFNVRFDLEMTVTDNPHALKEADPKGNSYEVREFTWEENIENARKEGVTAGFAINKNTIVVKPSYAEESTTAHEIGHTLGMDHVIGNENENGIMYSRFNKNRTEVKQQNIDEIINNKQIEVSRLKTQLTLTQYLVNIYKLVK